MLISWGANRLESLLDARSSESELGSSPAVTLPEAVARLARALDALDAAAGARLERDADYGEADAELQRMNADRSRLAQELDGSEARAERLAEANKEVSRRLVTAMETIRAVLDR